MEGHCRCVPPAVAAPRPAEPTDLPSYNAVGSRSSGINLFVACAPRIACYRHEVWR